MGDFHVPAAEDSDATDEEFYDGIVQHYENEGGYVDDMRIEGIRYYDDHPSQDREININVGDTFPLNNERVEAILHDDNRGLYLICTQSRGVASGMPFLIGSDETREIREFN